ncbi:MAG: hypothetical protein LBL91_01050 [Lachnospiraceae bacterium]|nr:hypothetical protein [Lachnospiraceae bacterium]
MKKIDIFKMIIILMCVISFIGLLLPYQKSIGEYREYLQENPDRFNVKEVDITNEDAIDVTIIENFKVYSYAMNDDQSDFIRGTSIINVMLIIILVASTAFILIFILRNKKILSIIFSILLLGSSLLMNADIVDRGVMPSSRYTYGISYYLYPIAAVVMLISIIITIVKDRKNNKMKSNK